MDNEYKVVGKFLSPSKVTGEKVKMVVVRDNRGAYIMSENDWRWMYGQNHPEKWKKNNSAA